jgi:hypothetical protein
LISALLLPSKALHTVLNFGEPANTSLLGGTALSIAYESEVNKLSPEKFTVFSIDHASPWKRGVGYQIPKDVRPLLSCRTMLKP